MAADRKSENVGTRLREAREKRGVSLREIAAVTRISVRVLEALEKNDISHLPGGIFSRSFVRSYAAQVGLDPEAAVEDFVKQFPHDTVTAGHPAASRGDDVDSFESDKRMATVVIRLIAVSVPLIVLLAYFGMSRGRSAAAPSGAASATAGAETRGERLVVELTAHRDAVVSAIVDDLPAVDVRFAAGNQRVFDAERRLSFTVDDPSAIEWSVNGTPGRGLGPAGTPAAVHLTLDNYRDYLITR